MRILHVIVGVDPRGGGPASLIRTLVRQQVSSGHRVTLLTTTIQASSASEAPDVYRAKILADPAFQGAEVCMVRAFGRRRPWSSWGLSVEGHFRIWRMLSDRLHAPQVIHIHGVFAHITTAAAAIARRHSIPYVIRVCGSLDPRCFGMGHNTLKRIFTQLILLRDLRRAKCIHAASEYEAEGLRCWLPGGSIQVIPHGVPLPNVDSVEASSEILAKYPQLRKKKVVLFIGRLVHNKRPEMIVEAMGLLRSEFPDLTLLLAGADEGQMSVVESTAQRLGLQHAIVSPGFLQGNLKEGAFAVADLFALPSVEENFSMAVIEAMAHGVPVLLSTGVASHVHVDTCKGGLTVEGTPEAFADGMRMVFEGDPKSMGRRGRDYVVENLSDVSVSKRIEQMYREIVG